jgi:hypothetical protein
VAIRWQKQILSPVCSPAIRSVESQISKQNQWGAEEAGVEPTGDVFAPPNGFEDRAGHRTRYSSIGLVALFVENRQCGFTDWLPGLIVFEKAITAEFAARFRSASRFFYSVGLLCS